MSRKLNLAECTDTVDRPLLLDERSAAQFLGVSLSYLRKSRSEGAPGGRTPAPPFRRVGGRVYYARDTLIEWVNGLEERRAV